MQRHSIHQVFYGIDSSTGFFFGSATGCAIAAAIYQSQVLTMLSARLFVNGIISLCDGNGAMSFISSAAAFLGTLTSQLAVLAASAQAACLWMVIEDCYARYRELNRAQFAPFFHVLPGAFHSGTWGGFVLAASIKLSENSFDFHSSLPLSIFMSALTCLFSENRNLVKASAAFGVVGLLGDNFEGKLNIFNTVGFFAQAACVAKAVEGCVQRYRSLQR